MSPRSRRVFPEFVNGLANAQMEVYNLTRGGALLLAPRGTRGGEMTDQEPAAEHARSCPHHKKGDPFYTEVDEKDPRQRQRLCEGMCPNRCGAMKRDRKRRLVASCPCCGLKWISVKVNLILNESENLKEE
jgi:hypothetical protein